MLTSSWWGSSNTSPPYPTSTESVGTTEENSDAALLESGSCSSGPYAGGSEKSSFRLPTLETTELLQKKDYVPSKFAEKKLHDATCEYQNSKVAFENRINEIETHYTSLLNGYEKHFSDHVSEMKAKAKRHVEVQRVLKKKLEEKLNSDIASKEKIIDDLRDDLAMSIQESQDKTKDINSKQNALSYQSSVNGKLECQILMESAILRKIEQDQYNQKYQEMEDRLKTSLSKLKAESLKKLQKEFEVSEVANSVQELVLRVELNFMREETQNAKKSFNSALLKAEEHEKSMLDEEHRSTQFILEKIEVLEKDHELKLNEIESSHIHTIEEMKGRLGVELDSQKAEITKLKTKYVGIKFQHNVDVARERKAQLALQNQLIETEVSFCLNKMVSLISKEKVESLSITSLKSNQYINIINPVRTPRLTPGYKIDDKTGVITEDEHINNNMHINIQTELGDGEETESIKSLLAKATKEAQSLNIQYDQALKDVSDKKKDRFDSKSAITNWLNDFEKEHGYVSTLDDRKVAQPLFESYQIVAKQYDESKEAKDFILTSKMEAEGRVTLILDQLKQLNVDEEDFKGLDFESDTRGKTSERIIKSVETQMENSKIISLESAADEAENLVSSQSMISPRNNREFQKELEQHIAEKMDQKKIIESLEDTIYQVKTDLDESTHKQSILQDDKDFIQNQLNAMIKEKRSDVLKRLTDETEKMHEELSKKTEELIMMTTEKTNVDSKVTELNTRIKVAEEELNARDTVEQEKLGIDNEKVQLRTQIAKQRTDVANKTKSATAGWNAAATADEEKDIAIQKAFKEGYDEAKNTIKFDEKSLHAAIEEKEVRVTELLVQVQEFEGKFRDAQKAVEEAQQAADEARLEANDAIASFGGGDDMSDMVNVSEFDKVRDELDEAQSEVVTLRDTINEMTEEAKVSAQTITVYEQLRSIAPAPSNTPSKNVSSKNIAAAAKSPKSLSEILSSAKSAIIKGTSLWKSHKKDDCFDIYMEFCQMAISNLHTEKLKGPLIDAVDEAEKFNSKTKGSISLRKSIDQLVNEGKTNASRREEEEAARNVETDSPNKSQHRQSNKVSTSSSGIVRELESELSNLKKQLEDVQEEKKKAVEQALSSNNENDENNSESGTLFRRAKDAERQVEVMKKQIAQMATVKKDLSKKGSSKEDMITNSEIRTLKRKIKTLEERLKGGGNGNNADAKRAQIQAEKMGAKKYKELENSTKKEIKTLEARALKAEKQLKKAEDESGPAIEERDALRLKIKEYLKTSIELENLKSQVSEIPRLQALSEDLESQLKLSSDTLKKESALRKKYKNDFEDLKGNIRVYARCRPMAKYEKERGCTTVVDFTSEDTVLLHSDRGDKDFQFDQVFSQTSKQEDVFEDTKRLIESCIDGYNVCLFAYGQTGSGKTFTMTGSDALPGLTPRAIDEIYRLIDERPNLQIKVSTYFVELYLDELVDLYWVLDNKKNHKAEPPKLDIKVNAKKMVQIQNCIIKEAPTPDDLMSLFTAGNLERHVGATKMNAESSRSHSIFAVLIESYDPSTKRTITGKLSLVDLAGSERADKTGATAGRLKEGIAINKSLSSLGDVISALSTGEKVIPYRNSKLTQMMQDSLGGNAKTLMFVNFSPADYNVDESVSALKYASRVKLITNDASKAQESAEVTRLKHIIKKLKAGQTAEEEEDDEDEK